MDHIKKIYLIATGCFFIHAVYSQSIKPSATQLAWHDMEFYLFTHFGPNTFTDLEWGHGTEKEEVFNPSQLDCRQWARTAKAAGARGIIITAKHHDGFCLWPSKYSQHTVRESSWHNGHGDVLKELSTACREYGLKFGVYLSPWDRNHPDYGTPKYNVVFAHMLREVLTQYGQVWELWWDGANGEGPNGKKQIYDWDLFKKTVHDLSPNTVIFSDVGPHIRWVGNENGIANTTNWNTLNTEGFSPGLGAPSNDTLGTGNVYGHHWIPAECDVSIRPGWFYHSNENDKVKTPNELFDLYLKSVGRGANFLLNVPPDPRGMIYGKDSIALVEFKKLRANNFKNDLAQKIKLQKILKNNYQLILLPKTTFNCIQLMENIASGQSISSFTIDFYDKNQIIKSETGTTIGHKRILTFPEIAADKIMISINDLYGRENLKSVKVYLTN